MKSLHTFALLLLITACQTSYPSIAPKNYIVENIIFKTHITSQSDFTVDDNGIQLTLKPVDARMFDGHLRKQFPDGRHLVLHVNQNFESDFTQTPDQYVRFLHGLADSLLAAGIDLSSTNSIIANLSGEFTYNSLLLYDKDVHTKSITDTDYLNPFSRDGRYLTVVEAVINNPSSDYVNYCIPKLLIHTETNTYSQYSKSQLLDTLYALSVDHELIDKLLLDDCQIVPPFSTLTEYAAFPSILYNDEFTISGIKTDTVYTNKYSVSHSTQNINYTFLPRKIEVMFGSSGSVQASDGSYSYSYYHNMVSDIFVFISNGQDFIRVDDNLFYADREMVATSFSVLLIVKRGDGFHVKVVPLEIHSDAVAIPIIME